MIIGIGAATPNVYYVRARNLAFCIATKTEYQSSVHACDRVCVCEFINDNMTVWCVWVYEFYTAQAHVFNVKDVNCLVRL